MVFLYETQTNVNKYFLIYIYSDTNYSFASLGNSLFNIFNLF